MKLGEKAHRGFLTNIRKRHFRDHFVTGNMLSRPATSYYLNDSNFETRIFLHNYFALLGDTVEAKAKWIVEIFSHNGERAVLMEGEFKGNQGAMIVVSDLPGVSEFGVIAVKLIFEDADMVIAKPYHAIYYIEYARRNVPRPQKIIYHSLGSPAAGIFDYARDNYTPGSFLPTDSKPYFLYANGTLLNLKGGRSHAKATLKIINWKGKILEIALPEIAHSLETKKVDILALCPDLHQHLEGKPFNLKIKGRNVLSKSFWYVLGEKVFLGEHF